MRDRRARFTIEEACRTAAGLLLLAEGFCRPFARVVTCSTAAGRRGDAELRAAYLVEATFVYESWPVDLAPCERCCQPTGNWCEECDQADSVICTECERDGQICRSCGGARHDPQRREQMQEPEPETPGEEERDHWEPAGEGRLWPDRIASYPRGSTPPRQARPWPNGTPDGVIVMPEERMEQIISNFQQGRR